MKIKDIIFRVFPKAVKTFDIVVTLYSRKGYDVIVSLVKKQGYSIVVSLTRFVSPTYDLVVTLMREVLPKYDIVVYLTGIEFYTPVSRDIFVSLQEYSGVQYGIIVTLVEGGDDSGCIELNCN